MKRVRTEDISLHNYIRNYILNEFVETDTALFNYLEEQSSTGSYVYEAASSSIPLPSSLGRGWRYLDNPSDTTEQQNSVIVYDELGSVISGSNYLIDYIDGRVIFPDLNIVPYSVTYLWNYISIVDEWSVVEASDPPVVVINLSGFNKEGFQLGAGKRVPRQVSLEVFATDTAERSDIMETLYDGLYLKSCPNQLFPNGTMLDWNGTFNQDYEYATISGSSSLQFEDVEARSISIPLLTVPNREMIMLSDLNRYRGRVRCSMFHYEESW